MQGSKVKKLPDRRRPRIDSRPVRRAPCFDGKNPLKRLIKPEEVANAVVWLCLPGSEAVNGQAIVISGGEV